MASNTDTNNHVRLSTAFEFDIGAPILPDRVTAGRFLRSAASRGPTRGPPPAISLAFGSSGQRVVIHNNNNSIAEAKRSAKRGEAQASTGTAVGSSEDTSLQTLNFGKAPTALASGQLYSPGSTEVEATYDALLFGATTSLLAYDVDQNKQLFYKDVEDGVQAIVCGPVMKSQNEGGDVPPLAVVGGNCSIFGFDRTGAERYWTVTGDQVTAMALLPWLAPPPLSSPPASTTGFSSSLALLAASEDFEIRTYDGEEAISTIHEVDKVLKLVPLWRPPRTAADQAAAGERCGRFAYLLDNGTVGVYERGERMWRVKGKSKPVSAVFCDVDGDGVEELVVGWKSGRVEVRTDRCAGLEKGGGLLYRDTYTSAIAAVLAEDYRQDGTTLPLICTVDGTVRGLKLLETRREEAAEVRQLQVLETLAQEKEQLAAQLTSLEEQLARRAAGEQDTTMPESGVEVHCRCAANVVTQQVDVHVEVCGSAAERGDLVVHSCLLKCDAWSATGQDVMAYCAPVPGTTLTCSFDHPDDLPLLVMAFVAVGPPFGENYQIHEVEVRVPRFIMYALPHMLTQVPVSGARQLTYLPPAGYVLLRWRDALKLDVVERWLRQSFGVPDELSLSDADSPTNPVLHLELLHVRDGSSLGIEMRNGTAAGGDAFSVINLRSDHLGPCGEIISAFVEDLKGAWTDGQVDPAEVRCEITAELERLRGILARVDEFNEVRMKLTTDMADAASIVKTLLGRAEDARLLGDMNAMKKAYAALYDVDQELLSENAKRISNYGELKLALKDVNIAIQHAGKLRFGSARTQLIADCRNALKENKVNSLLEIIRTGSE